MHTWVRRLPRHTWQKKEARWSRTRSFSTWVTLEWCARPRIAGQVVKYKFIKTTFIKKKFRQNPHSSKSTFIKNHFHQKPQHTQHTAHTAHTAHTRSLSCSAHKKSRLFGFPAVQTKENHSLDQPKMVSHSKLSVATICAALPVRGATSDTCWVRAV